MLNTTSTSVRIRGGLQFLVMHLLLRNAYLYVNYVLGLSLISIYEIYAQHIKHQMHNYFYKSLTAI